jgi:hypothetical protein
VVIPRGSITARLIAWRIGNRLGMPSVCRMSAGVLRTTQERGGAWRRPALRSTTRRSRRSAREPVMRRTARLKTLGQRAPQPTDNPPQDNAHLRAPDLAAPAHPAVGGRELDSRRMSYAPGRPWDVNRGERRRTDQTDDERKSEKALAGEIHDF